MMDEGNMMEEFDNEVDANDIGDEGENVIDDME